ncbi:hypothetical protein LOK49_LG05G00935 [Camellia lanceoleosa]|uniref:Uncharacterized protein n=1 Tax=Camellia lanceoleosa TaxID=1840588 RepID=A0ACC0HNN7_9ERIC|nr:hypothetical protein LOK49_LG05G00935 [Camellia lanceoleosa]
MKNVSQRRINSLLRQSRVLKLRLRMLVARRTELEEIIPSAEEICRFYDPAVSLNMDLKTKLESSWEKFDALLLELQDKPKIFGMTASPVIRSSVVSALLLYGRR